jgi:hypothetical protein
MSLRVIMDHVEQISLINYMSPAPVLQNFDTLLLSKATDLSDILQQAISKGTSGASAASVQVMTLMWLRTTLNYQYRYGTNTTTALTTLWREGGITRLYQGLPFALIQGPLSRFGDTAANALILAYIDSIDPTGTIPLFVRTAAGSVSAGAWRLVILPIDTLKTTLQVDGQGGFDLLQERLKKEGPSVLYNGAVASVLATIVGHYPWFVVYNTLSESLPTVTELHHLADVARDATAASSTIKTSLILGLDGLDDRFASLLRGATIGVVASTTSDVCSNSLRVLKTVRQTADMNEQGNEDTFSYAQAAKSIVREDGISGLLGRGLQTRILANALQGALFSVLFKYFSQGR